MTKSISEELIPRSDKIFSSFGRVNYEDCFCILLKPKEKIDIDNILKKLIISFPNWFKILINFRNLFALFFGLKTGKIGRTFEFHERLNLKEGQYLGDFLIFLKEENLLIVELKDKHLDFRSSIEIIGDKSKTEVTLKTIVKINNVFGRCYFFIIKPFHRLIVPKILYRLSNEI